MSKRIFITGTNTEVGKTYIGTAILKSLIEKYNCLAFKPVETGCKQRKNELLPSDSKKYESILKGKINLGQINPYRFIPPVSPYKAIKDAKKRIYIKNYHDKLNKLPKSDLVLVEGAGGAFSPIALDGLNIDMMKAINSKNILVIKDQLGCIGSTISHILAFERLDVKIDILILNTIKVNKMDNYNEIKKYTDIPLFQVSKKQNNKSTNNIVRELLRLL